MAATLLIIPALAVLAVLCARGLSRWIGIPVVVFELVLGIVAGPDVLGWVGPSEFMDTLAQFGLAMLFFVAGTEINPLSLRGRTGRNAMVSWLISLVAGLALGWCLFPHEAVPIVAVALSSTALGVLLPILRDAGLLGTPFGNSISALGAVGEFGPVIAISLFLGSRDPGPSSLVLLLFAVLAGFAIWLSLRLPQGALYRVINATLRTTGQFAVRVLFLILGALLALSLFLSLDLLLGAFTAGVIWRLLMRDASEADRQAVESKLEGVAFGFLIPVFFVYTGVTFNLGALTAKPSLFLMIPVVLITLLVVRGIPSMLAAPAEAGWRDRIAIGLMGATGLPIIVAVSVIGVDSGLLTTATQAVLVGAGMISVLTLPLIAMSLRAARSKVRR